MPKFDIFWFLAGILFMMFVWPLVAQFLGRLKGQPRTGKTAAA